MSESDSDPIVGYPELLRAIEEARGVEAPPPPESLLRNLEEERLAALRCRARSSHFRALPFGLGTGLAAALAIAFVVLSPSRVDPGATARVIITSPGDVISETTPEIAWTSKVPPGQRYDVWILPGEGDPLEVASLFESKHVVSPVAFDSLTPTSPTEATLSPSRGYRVLVCLADGGRLAGVPVPFRVGDP